MDLFRKGEAFCCLLQNNVDLHCYISNIYMTVKIVIL